MWWETSFAFARVLWYTKWSQTRQGTSEIEHAHCFSPLQDQMLPMPVHDWSSLTWLCICSWCDSNFTGFTEDDSCDPYIISMGVVIPIITVLTAVIVITCSIILHWCYHRSCCSHQHKAKSNQVTDELAPVQPHRSRSPPTVLQPQAPLQGVQGLAFAQASVLPPIRH